MAHLATSLQTYQKFNHPHLQAVMSQLQHTVDYSKSFCKLFGQRFNTKGNTIKTNQNRTHVGNKTNLNQFKRTEINQYGLSDHNKMKLKINNRNITKKSQNIWRLNNTHLNNTEVKINKKYFELNENESITYQNLWDAVKTVLRGKCIALNAYNRKEIISDQ